MNPVQHTTGVAIQDSLIGILGGGATLTAYVILRQAVLNARLRAARREASLAEAIARHPVTRSKLASPSDRGTTGVAVLLGLAVGGWLVGFGWMVAECAR